MDDKEYRISIRALKNMIDKADRMMKQAIKRQDWPNAALQEAYLSGLRQALAIFARTL